MKLYELSNDKRFAHTNEGYKRFTLNNDGSGTIFTYDRTDGAYCACYLGNAIVYISKNTEIKEAE